MIYSDKSRMGNITGKIIYLLCVYSLLSCSHKSPKEQPAQFSEDFFKLSLSNVKDTLNVDIEELVEAFTILPLDNTKEEALCSPLTMHITDKHIGINPYDRGAAYKLFTRDGHYLCDVGAFGQGPGEYTSVLCHQIDENERRIYLNTFNASKIMTYDFNGKYLNDIPLAYCLKKGSFKVDNEKKIIYCFDVPFGRSPFVWKQDFNGKVQGKVLYYPHSIIPDFSNDEHTLFNTNSFYTSLSVYNTPMSGTLYHYYLEADSLKPIFSIDMEEQKYNHNYMNTPLNIYVGLSSGVGSSQSPYSHSRYDIIKVDKKTHEAHFTRLFSRDYGNLPINLYLLQIRYGHIYTWMEPIELIAALDVVLSRSNLKPEVRDKATKLRNKLHENDNNVLLFGKLKQR